MITGQMPRRMFGYQVGRYTSGTLARPRLPTEWKRQIDGLMQEQMTTLNYEKRMRLYNQVQQLIAENLPFIFLATVNTLASAKAQIGNFHPAVTGHDALWNADQLYLRSQVSRAERAAIK